MAGILSSETNYSVYAIPLYFVLCLAPHLAAVNIATGGDAGKWDNRNPRASTMKESLSKRIPAAQYAKYERAEAAHYNSMESFPLFTAAVVLGNLAKISNSELNTFVVGMGIQRMIYIISYIQTASNSWTYLRTALWFAGTGWSMRTLFKAASALA